MSHLQQLPDLDVIVAERCRRDLKRFVKEFWDVVDPRPLIWNWHIDVLCNALMDVSFGRTQNLAICVPPGSSKSLLVSVLWPAWEWLPGNWPAASNLFASRSKNVSIRDSTRCREALKSDKYTYYCQLLAQMHNQPAWNFAGDQDQKANYKNSAGGHRLSTTVDAKSTGLRANRVVVDDPYDVDEVTQGTSERVSERMKRIQEWWDLKLASRLNDQSRGSRVLIMQRLHPDDLVGVLQVREPQLWRFIVLPAEWDPELACPEDPRTTPGELFFPYLFPREFLEKKKTTEDGKGQYSAQYQQRPVPPEGLMFKAVWFDNLYKWQPGDYRENRQLPPFRRTFLSFDTAMKGGELNDFSVGLLAGETEFGDIYLLDVWREKVGDEELRPQALALVKRYKPRITLIEDKGTGTGLIPFIRRQGQGITSVIGVMPIVAKDIRASMTTHFWKARRIFLPDNAPWKQAFINEHKAFNPPHSAKDDQVDATSQMLNHIDENQSDFTHRIAAGGTIVELGPTGQMEAYDGRVDVQRERKYLASAMGAQVQNSPPPDQGMVLWAEMRGMIGEDAFAPTRDFGDKGLSDFAARALDVEQG